MSRAEIVRMPVPAIVERYRAGESLQEVAKDCRVHRRTIYAWLLAGLGDEAYHELVTEILVARVSDADEELDAARLSQDPVRVSAARETARFARMDLERRRPHLYGPKQEMRHTGETAPTLNIVLLERPTPGGAGVGTPVLERMPALGAVEEAQVVHEEQGEKRREEANAEER